MALTVLALAFLFNFISRGLADSFLVFMLAFEKTFGWSHAALAGVYSVYLLTLGACAPMTGMLIDRLGPRAVYLVGLVLLAASLCAASFANSLLGIYLSLGLGTGMACSALGMVPAAALIGRWFDRNLSTALGFAYAGFGSGILLMVPLSQYLIDAIGWRETYRWLTAALLVLIPIVAFLPWRLLSQGRGLASGDSARQSDTDLGPTPVDLHWTIRSAVRSSPFWLLVQVFFFTAAGMHCVIVQTVAYLVESGYRAIDAAAAFGTAGMLSIVGVLATGVLSDRFGHRRVALASFAGTMSGMVALYASGKLAAAGLLAVYILAFGVSQGARGPIVSALANRIFRSGPAASIFGLIFMLMSFGSALGAWVSGLLHQMTGSYDMAFVFSALCLLIAAAPFIFPSPIASGMKERS